MSKPLDATIDSVQGAITLLWDFLSRPAKEESENTDSKKIADGPKEPRRIPAVIVDTMGEDIDDAGE